MNDGSADLAGYGPIGADIARQVVDTLGEGVWDWTVLHPGTGTPIADGTTRRRPTASQIRKVRARNRTRVAPGCRTPVVDCDIDHTRPWAETGITDSEDLAALSRHDHRLRHQTGWTYQTLDDGGHLWTSPLGPSYTTSGADLPMTNSTETITQTMQDRLRTPAGSPPRRSSRSSRRAGTRIWPWRRRPSSGTRDRRPSPVRGSRPIR